MVCYIDTSNYILWLWLYFSKQDSFIDTKTAPAFSAGAVSTIDFYYRLNAFTIKSTISTPILACASSVEAPMCGVLLTRGCL